MSEFTADQAWLKTVSDVLYGGKPVAPQSSTGAAGKPSYEILFHQMNFSLQYPIVTCKPNTSWLYMACEAMWVIDGSNKLDYSPEIQRIQEPYSDNKVTLFGAYGPSFEAQASYVVNKLNDDPTSRQAIIAIWRRNPKFSRDIPCSIALQFIVRDGYIHCHVYMRSSDVGKGLPYDMFTFACMTAEIASRLNIEAELGDCYITAGSRHIYIDQIDNLQKLSNKKETIDLLSYAPWQRWKWPAIKLALQQVVNNDREYANHRNQISARSYILGASGETNY